MGRVSVVIPNYNYGRYLREAIDSVLSQTHPPHEVIVVDDGSTDDSGAILAGYGDAIITVQQQNQGVGAARNNGAQIATGEFLAFLDADDYWAPEKLEKQLAKFDSDPEIGLAHCGFVNVDIDGKPLDKTVEGDEGRVADRILRMAHAVFANTIVLRRAIFNELGGYDTNKDLHPSEDWDLIYRAACICKVAFVPEPLLFYRQHGSGGHTNISRMERAMLIGYGKAFPNGNEKIQSIRGECYGNLYRILAGSYFRSGKYRDFVRNAAKSIWNRPRNISYFAGFPLRKLRKN